MKSSFFSPPTMRAVSFCKTSASTVTRSTSTLTISSGSADLLSALVEFPGWVSFALTRRDLDCEVTNEWEEMIRRQRNVERSPRKRNNRVGFRCFMVHLPRHESAKSLRLGERIGKRLGMANRAL